MEGTSQDSSRNSSGAASSPQNDIITSNAKDIFTSPCDNSLAPKVFEKLKRSVFCESDDIWPSSNDKSVLCGRTSKGSNDLPRDSGDPGIGISNDITDHAIRMQLPRTRNLNYHDLAIDVPTGLSPSSAHKLSRQATADFEGSLAVCKTKSKSNRTHEQSYKDSLISPLDIGSDWDLMGIDDDSGCIFSLSPQASNDTMGSNSDTELFRKTAR
ncbi:hypothetical protein V494_02767 [Pseudogymnoascus sp. VKM F-4513 (FW-928)]|nr:hypothetical protein V494_02767 [Pseudogymnoascus sp. VKM F-4513 (FW-928)]